MLIRPSRRDLQLIGYYVGKVVGGLGLMQLIPLVVALGLREWNAASALAVGAALALVIASVTELRFATRDELEWSHGMVTVALSWAIGAVLIAVPLYLSGHYASYLDAVFEAMSGLTTSGLSLTQDVDHAPLSLNLLRHITHFAGGQGIVIVMLSLFTSSAAAQVGTLYVGEGREERVLPNVVRTARFLFAVAGSYLVLGTAALAVAGMAAGLSAGRALFHAVTIFMAAFDTGGFTPQSTSLGYYHSPAFELVAIVLMVAGTLSFGLHFRLWTGRLREAHQNIETRILAVSFAVITLLTLIGLAAAGTLRDPVSLFRKGVFTVISAHTGTGFQVNAGRLYVTDWGAVAPAAIVAAMALGGMASSTAGGIKALRVAAVAKSTLRDIRRALLPGNALLVASYHADRRRILSDREVSGAVTIMLLFLMTYIGGALVGVAYGFDLQSALFESTSAAANVGLSVGVLSPDVAVPLKVTYIAQMWIGRLEFMSVFALFGYVIATVRGRI